MVFNLSEGFYDRPSPVECYKLNIIAYIYVIMLVLSLLFNSGLLIVFARYKDLIQSLNVYIFVITALNLFGSVTQFPVVIAANLHCHWMFKKLGCDISGYIMYAIGCAHIYLTMAMSIERYVVLKNPAFIKKLNFGLYFKVISICILLSLLWATFPLFGWSYYTLEGALTSCSVEWADRSWNVFTYNVTIWVFGFIVPLSAILYCNIMTIKLIKNTPKATPENPEETRTAEEEKKITFTVLIYIWTFLITWTPYSLVSMWSAFVNPDHISPLGSTIPAMFAKSSMVWSTILFVYSNKPIREKFLNTEDKTVKSGRGDLELDTNRLSVPTG